MHLQVVASVAVAEQLGAARQEAQTEAQHLRAQVGPIVYLYYPVEIIKVAKYWPIQTLYHKVILSTYCNGGPELRPGPGQDCSFIFHQKMYV